MAFKLTREQKTTIEGIEIDGEEIKVVPDLLRMGPEFNRRFNKLIIAEKKLQGVVDTSRQSEEKVVDIEKLEELQAAYGEAIIGILDFVFGSEGAEKILKFYEENYIELLTAMQPYLLEIVIPAIEAETERNRKRHAEMHKGKQKKRFGR